ncbi:NADPH:quinone reductase [Variovorax sp. J22R115]|uniref:NADPH:quinone reductase n=1 Tax=Variovorax sp. J22R115 TaxID=3053509 RepID=UPI002576AD68|nr:NADPH:quinone reductase [Variovorax sp. J22R115]MDM0050564.1 NADPH:quinone reductase [Variovorax sp. J22R115]
MRAAYYERTGRADEVLLIGELPDPQPEPGEVRVRMQWSGVNPSDVKARAGSRGPTPPFPRIVPHSDGMGLIDAVGEGVDPKRIGERVWTWNAAWERASGTAAQYIALPERQAVPLPENVPGEVGACLGIPALTALHAVLSDGGVSGQRVLVAGGAGAVGHYAIQFARLLGAAQVLSTVSNESKEAVARNAGATEVINYRKANVAQAVLDATSGEGVDRVIEVDIAANAALDLEIIRHEGLWVVYGSGSREFSLPFFPLISKNVLARFFMVYRLSSADRQRAISLLTDWLRRDLLKHSIGQQFSLDQIADAHSAVEMGGAMGNVVLAIG